MVRARPVVVVDLALEQARPHQACPLTRKSPLGPSGTGGLNFWFEMMDGEHSGKGYPHPISEDTEEQYA